MAKGTVKDPTGHQSKEYDYGYIKRGALKWPGVNRFKVIPFLSPRNAEGEPLYEIGEGVDFDVKEATITYNGRTGTIGIAVLRNAKK